MSGSDDLNAVIDRVEAFFDWFEWKMTGINLRLMAGIEENLGYGDDNE